MLPIIRPGIHEQIQEQFANSEKEKQWDQRHHLAAKIPEVQYQMKGLDKYIQDYNKNKETLNNSILLANTTATGRIYQQKFSLSPVKSRKGIQQSPFSVKGMKFLNEQQNNILPGNIDLETINNTSDTNFYSYIKKNQELEERSQELLNRINVLFQEKKFEQFHCDYFNYLVQKQDMYGILKREINLIEAGQSPYQLVASTITEREKILRSLIDVVEQIDGSASWEQDPKALQIFQKMSQLREYTVQVIEKIDKWRKNLFNFPQEVMQQLDIQPNNLTFFYSQENYLIKLYSDSSFLSKSNLANKIPLSFKHDPFLIFPTKLIIERSVTNPIFISSFDLSEDLRERILKVERILIKEIQSESDNKVMKSKINFGIIQQENADFIVYQIQKNDQSSIRNLSRSVNESNKSMQKLGQLPKISRNDHSKTNQQGLIYRPRQRSITQMQERLNKSENRISSTNATQYDNGKYKPQSTIVFKRVKGNLKQFSVNGGNLNQSELLPTLQQQPSNKQLNRSISTGVEKQRVKIDMDTRRQSRDFITINNDMTYLLRKKRDSKLYESAIVVEKVDTSKQEEVKQKLQRECCSNMQELNEKGYYTKPLPDDEPYYMKLGTQTSSFRTLKKSSSCSPSKRRLYQDNPMNENNTRADFYERNNINFSKQTSPKQENEQQEEQPVKKVIRFFTLDDELSSSKNNETQINQMTTQDHNDSSSSLNVHNIIVLGQLENKDKEISIQPDSESQNEQKVSNFSTKDQKETNSQITQKSQRLGSIKLQSESQIRESVLLKPKQQDERESILSKQRQTDDRESIQIKSKSNEDYIDRSSQSPSKNHKDSSFMLEDGSTSIMKIKKIQSQTVLPDNSTLKIQEEEDSLPEAHSEMLYNKKKKTANKSNQPNKESNLIAQLSKKSSVKKLDQLEKDQKSMTLSDNKQQNSSQSSIKPQKVGAYKYVRTQGKGTYSKSGIYPQKGTSKSPQRLTDHIDNNPEVVEGDKMFRSLVLNRQQQQQQLQQQQIEEQQQGADQSQLNKANLNGPTEKKQKSSFKKAALALIQKKKEETKALQEAAQKQKEYEQQLKNNQEYNEFLRREQEQKLQNIQNEDLEEALTNQKQNPYNTNAFKVSIQVVPVSLKEEDVNGVVHNYFKKIHPFFSGLFMRDAFTLIYQLKNDLNFNFLQAIDRRTMQVLGLLVVHPYFDYGQQKGPFDFFEDSPAKDPENPFSDEENFFKNDEDGEEEYDPNSIFYQSQYSQQNGANSSFFSSKTTFHMQNKLLQKNNKSNEVRKIMIIDHFSCIDVNMFKGLFSLFTEYIWTHDVADSIEVKLYTSPQLLPLQEKIEQMIIASTFTFKKSFQNNSQRVLACQRDEEKYPIDENLLGDSGKTPDQLFFNSFIMISKQEIPEKKIFNKNLYVDNGQRFSFLCALSHLFKDMYISDVLLKLTNENQHEKIKQLYNLAYSMRLNIRKRKIFSDLFQNQEFDNIEKMNIAIESMSLLPTCEYDDNTNNKVYMNTFSLKLNLPHACHTVMTNSAEKQMLYIRISNNSNQVDSSMASTSNSTPLVSSVVYSKVSFNPMIQIQTVDTKYTLFFLQADDFMEKEHKDLYLYIYEFFKDIENKEATYKTIWLPQFSINFPHIRNDDFDSVLSKNRVFSSLNFSFKLPDYIGGKLLYQEPSMQKSIYVKPPFIFGIIDNQFDIHMPNQPIFSCLIDENDVLYFNQEKINKCLLYIDKEVDDGPIQGYPKITGIQNNIERTNLQKIQTSAALHHQAYKEKILDQQQ